MTFVDKTQAILALAPNAQFNFRVDSDDVETIEWLSDDITQPSDSAINTKLAELQAAQPLNELRAVRNTFLAETDWWVLPDRTATQAQLDYRQALRDITNTYSSLDDVVWPEKP